MSIEAENLGAQASSLAELGAAAVDYRRVAGLTHELYRYPARFSPTLARTCIKLFTRPGDVVLDPFCGGGTTLVEAATLGRKAVGIDINELAIFVARAKTLTLSDAALKKSDALFTNLLERARTVGEVDPEIPRHLKEFSTWRIGRVLAAITSFLDGYRRSPVIDFIRSSVLKTSQWALDGRRRVPSLSEFRTRLRLDFESSKRSLLDYRANISRWPKSALDVRLHRMPAENLTPSHVGFRPVRLVLTSPPYPGIHVLYHRWQVGGRRETEAPYWLADVRDGASASYYTMGPRRQPDWTEYFERMSSSLKSIHRVSDDQTKIVQVLGFSSISSQLPRYTDLMKQLGFEEIIPGTDADDGRIWRRVPNRKWHADRKGNTDSSQEVVLVHRIVR